MNKTKIQWCDYTSNPIRPEVRHADGTWRRKGWFCTKVSSGCANCYAERMNQRCSESGAGIGNGLAFTAGNEAKVRFVLDEGELRSIIAARRPPQVVLDGVGTTPPTRVFVGDMTDLWHPLITFELLDGLWAVMAMRPDLTFMLLTKRPERMLEYLRSRAAVDASGRAEYAPQWYHRVCHWLDEGEKGFCGRHWERCHESAEALDLDAPLPNVQLGVTAENQQTAASRIRFLLQCPAAVRFVSYEPALGPVDFSPWLNAVHADEIVSPPRREHVPAFQMGGAVFPAADETPWYDGLNGIIAGGESGPNARPAHPDWFRRVRDDCDKAAGKVQFFFKQWGEWAPFNSGRGEFPPGPHDGRAVCLVKPDGEAIRPYCQLDAPGHEMARVGKEAAGRLLDGRTHDELPGSQRPGVGDLGPWKAATP